MRVKFFRYLSNFNIFPLVPQFKNVSKEAKSIIEAILVKEKSRPTAKEVLDHPWLKTEIDKPLAIDIDWKSLKNFYNHGKLKKIALTYIASQLSEVEIDDLGDISRKYTFLSFFLILGSLFKKMDINGDGQLTFDELKTGLYIYIYIYIIYSSIALSGRKEFKEQDIKNLMSSMDTDGSGAINYTEFIAAALDKSIYMQQEKLLSAFKAFDTDGSGKISSGELMNIIGGFIYILLKNERILGFLYKIEDEQFKGHDSAYWKKIIKEADTNNDGEVDYVEFLEFMGK